MTSRTHTSRRWTRPLAIALVSALSAAPVWPSLVHGGLGAVIANAAESGKDQGAGGHAGKSKGPDPNCPYQDGTRRGPRHAGGAEAGGRGGSGTHGSSTSSSDTAGGGGAGGESFVCDSPGGWNLENKVFRR